MSISCYNKYSNGVFSHPLVLFYVISRINIRQNVHTSAWANKHIKYTQEWTSSKTGSLICFTLMSSTINPQTNTQDHDNWIITRYYYFLDLFLISSFTVLVNPQKFFRFSFFPTNMATFAHALCKPGFCRKMCFIDIIPINFVEFIFFFIVIIHIIRISITLWKSTLAGNETL